MTEGSPPAKTFVGVRFLLLGFDPFDERQVRSKLVDCGGEDVAHYSPNCTHVIVDKIVYDDPVCVAARNDAKTLVTALWVHHSFDVGLPIDPTWTMVGLMGAQFSKPLVANKVTHLVCYKFEGEKYEIAKKIPKMKLVNHRWLEDWKARNLRRELLFGCLPMMEHGLVATVSCFKTHGFRFLRYPVC